MKLTKTASDVILSEQVLYFPSQGHGGSVMLCLVLVSGAVNDYAAYIGRGESDWVRKFGDKMPLVWAKAFFPEIEEKRYRA